ncbi:hypothetical protein HCY66_06385 [Acinetobacter radioresistens]|uniref:hypothetical protein n=1 Tax=Acinetobacter radioresistens TaxID=40216 RepID=UPI00200351CE|nr:hypothetical protein [Acinetobacter radioresistens]MCK4089713.1 hypothetical protein [Acinetobacter radioresistens]
MDIQKEREAYKAALRNLENEFFFATPFDIWLAAKREAQAVPEGFVLVSKELPEPIAEAMALERVPKPFGETDPVWVEISERSYKDRLVGKKWELWRDYKAMIESQEAT